MRAAARRVIVLIISHKPVPSRYEEISLRQCVRVLGAHPATFLCPEGLDCSWYERFVPEIPIEFVDRQWLTSYAMFNAFKISPFLYRKYLGFEHILFYEPDAFVFSDTLDEWCDRHLDYIGAPWFEGFAAPKSGRIVGVGNGGLSLRSVRKHLEIAERFEMDQFLHHGYGRHMADKLRFAIAKCASFVGAGEGNPCYIGPSHYGHEDQFWGFEAAKIDPSFKIASPDEAMKFSFEAKPRLLYEMNGRNLPFGCHAWFKHDLAFWKPFIEDFGYRIPADDSLASTP